MPVLTDDMTYNDRFIVHNEEYVRVRTENDFTTIWACYEIDEDLTDWDDVPYPDMKVLWFENISIKVVPYPTWLELWHYAEVLYLARIAKTDYGHDSRYIERFYNMDNGNYQLWTGS